MGKIERNLSGYSFSCNNIRRSKSNALKRSQLLQVTLIFDLSYYTQTFDTKQVIDCSTWNNFLAELASLQQSKHRDAGLCSHKHSSIRDDCGDELVARTELVARARLIAVVQLVREGGRIVGV